MARIVEKEQAGLPLEPPDFGQQSGRVGRFDQPDLVEASEVLEDIGDSAGVFDRVSKRRGDLELLILSDDEGNALGRRRGRGGEQQAPLVGAQRPTRALVDTMTDGPGPLLSPTSSGSGEGSKSIAPTAAAPRVEIPPAHRVTGTGSPARRRKEAWGARSRILPPSPSSCSSASSRHKTRCDRWAQSSDNPVATSARLRSKLHESLVAVTRDKPRTSPTSC